MPDYDVSDTEEAEGYELYMYLVASALMNHYHEQRVEGMNHVQALLGVKEAPEHRHMTTTIADADLEEIYTVMEHME